ncbi:putative gamma-glutamylcyclotransferase At3g02910 [Humulus lupulus]|uniref:putative gamma-glutamylcyclotransferase At3g02910 n=1 Tax=Humulus lupulus TaxID=3486 RepID=UPI002B40B19C|nr:putative gamma-glutamylcyclotransferase At3g02910 [Humulus lupulus]
MVSEKKNMEKEKMRLVFTYGTLKQGFSNHVLLQDLIRTGDAIFIGNYRTHLNYPLVCGPYRVPFLLNLPGSGQRVIGELYAVSASALARLDELEGTTRCHYQRLPIQLRPHHDDDGDDGGGSNAGLPTSAEAYFAHSSYAAKLWNKNGRQGLMGYTEEVARGYVKRKDRPQNLTFLDHIHSFLSSQ